MSKDVIRPRHSEKNKNIVGKDDDVFFYIYNSWQAGRGNGVSGFVMICAEKRKMERMIMMSSSLTCAILYYTPSQCTKYQPHILLASKGLLSLPAK